MAGAPVGVLSQTDLVIHDRERIDVLTTYRDPLEDFTEYAEIPINPKRAGRDVAVGSVADAAQVRDLMTPTVFTVRLDAPAAQVVEDMLALRVHRLFVVDKGGVLVGVITATDVLRRLEAKPDEDA